MDVKVVASFEDGIIALIDESTPASKSYATIFKPVAAAYRNDRRENKFDIARWGGGGHTCSFRGPGKRQRCHIRKARSRKGNVLKKASLEYWEA